MPEARPKICTECGERFESKHPKAKTCSEKCRKARQRRIKRARSEGAKQKGLQLGMTTEERKDVIADVIKEETRPLVREGLGEEVQDAITSLVRLTPKVVSVLEAALEGDDDLRAMQAAGIVARYTIGNKQISENEGGKLEVHIGLPRPDSTEAAEAPVSSDVVELRVCEQCTLEKTVDEFDGRALRCRQCQDDLKLELLQQHHGEDDEG